MYNEYEDYMRSVLGYPPEQSYYNTYDNVNMYYPYRTNDTADEVKYRDMYPEIYKILNPMVTKLCESKRGFDFSSNDIEAMTDEIYSNVVSSVDVVNVNITSGSEVNNVQTRSGNMKVQEKSQNETRACCQNSTLRDLVKILLLNQIINNKPNKPGRPPRPPMPPYGENIPRPPRPPYGGNMPRPPYRDY